MPPRWETIAGFINAHSSEKCRKKSSRQVIGKVKALQKMEASEKDTQNQMAFSQFAKQHVVKGHVEATPTERYGKHCTGHVHCVSLHH